MTATDELRRMLDERGVEWWNDTDPEPQSITMARAGGQLIAYHENANGSIGYHVCNTHDLTPEQAVAATLGVETCHIVKASRKYVLSDGTELFEDGCSVCNGYIGEGDNYCPNCGRRIEVDE